MKKHNEGYTLVLVMVVLVVLSLLATYVLTFSLRNLKTQKAAALRDQEYYAAVGAMEETVGRLQAFAEKNEGAVLLAVVDPEQGQVYLAPLEVSQQEGEEEAQKNELLISGVKAVEIKLDKQNMNRLSLELVYSSGSSQIDCTVYLLATVEKLQNDKLKEDNAYMLNGLSGVEYASYSISTVEGGTADE